MKNRSILIIGVLLLILVIQACSGRDAGSIEGVWDAVVLNKAGEEVAFKLEIRREGDRLIGSLVNGDQRVESTSGRFDGRKLELRYDFYDGDLEATLIDGELKGEFRRQWRKQMLKRELRARRSSGEQPTAVGAGQDNVAGDWVLRVGEEGNQRLWRAVFRQKGGEVTGTIIPLSGDWGTLTGKIENGRLTLSKFDGINAYLFKARVTEDGRLEGLLNSERKVIAERMDKAKAGELTDLPDPDSYTSMKNPAEPFRFSFPDLEGRLVSSTDDRFRNKVLIASIGGSWCPNCHEEAPFLNDLYAQYKDQGLEIIGLMFEYTGQVARDTEQMKIFARRYDVRYPLLLAGSTDEGEIAKRLPQLNNFGGYPTTIFVGRDGLVKRIHVGYDGPATGERHEKLKTELEQLVKSLLESSDFTTSGLFPP